MEKLTFKKYLESREQLLQAVKTTPKMFLEYTPRGYCTLNVGDDEDTKISMHLKPKHSIIVEWLYIDVNNPTPLSVRFKGLDSIDEEQTYSIIWTPLKFQRWLSRHVINKNNII